MGSPSNRNAGVTPWPGIAAAMVVGAIAMVQAARLGYPDAREALASHGMSW